MPSSGDASVARCPGHGAYIARPSKTYIADQAPTDREAKGDNAMFTRRLRFVLILAAILVSVSWIASADTAWISFTGYNANLINDGSTMFGPYYGQINNGPVVEIWCVDFIHPAWPGDSWTTNATALAGDNFDNTYQKDKTTYLAIAWLISQYQKYQNQSADPNDLTVPTFEQAEYQYAIWNFSSSDWKNSYYAVYTNPSVVPAAVAMQAYALSVASSVDPSGWTILTDDGNNPTDYDIANSTTQQELMVQETVPEPSLMLMLLIGLSAVCVYCYRAGCN